ncbi:MAG TPA: PfkB family carbohydrate kinase [Rectinema sp.]|nr:PfkB family carbohydrate kinase [Rectinema sp.]HPK80009.1 PfkB family carbohydrate kinase [Rectinema sp.]HRT39117.1 PfkB family carbohydrate kinase [Rectinema sp.]
MQYDIVMMGHISKDIIIDETGNESKLYGGALLYSSISAARAGAHVLAITKAAPEDFCALDIAKEQNGIEILAIQSPKTTSIRNVFLSEDHERRETSLLSSAEPFLAADIPSNAETKIIDLAGLFVGELPDNLIEELAPRGAIAVDAQGLLREAQPDGRMLFRDWKNKHHYMPFVSYFKADAAEAEILTGLPDREEAARKIAAWGRNREGQEPEVMITYNTEVIVLVDGRIYRAPYTPSNLSGRTGRGDTTFAAYLAWRLGHDPQESVRFAAALCSIKMEKPGPFSGTLEDVFARM